MIPLTRIRHGQTLYLNPDLIERVDTHVDTVVKLRDGTEYVVVETGDEIVQRIIEFRARVLALSEMIQTGAFRSSPPPPEPHDAAPHGELTNPDSAWAPTSHEEVGR